MEYILPKITVGCDTPTDLENKSHNFISYLKMTIVFIYSLYLNITMILLFIYFLFFLFSFFSFFILEGRGRCSNFLIKSPEDDQTQNRKLTGRK